MLSHEYELRWWQPKASGEKTVDGFLTSRDFANLKSTRPSVNYAKDWLDHSFLFPGLVWSEKEFYFGYDH